MKLLSKYYRANIFATIIVVLLSSVCYYFMIHYILIEQLDDALNVEEQEVIDYVKENGRLPEPSSYKDQQVYFKAGNPQHIQRSFNTIVFYAKDENTTIASRELVFPIKINDQPYLVYVLKSQEETEGLIHLILVITLVVVVILLLVVFFINRFVLKRLWKPFDFTLLQLKKFDLSGKTTLQLQPGRIDEFNELNKAVTIMATHVSQEYNTLKEFTENASHEMQTPLAIINSKLDLLIQGENITEQQMGQLQSIYNALDRLSKLNHSLLLLTKIDNNQFAETETIFLNVAIQEKLFQFEESIENKKILVHADLALVKINCNKYLLDILLSNLLNNSIRYNMNAGTVSIILTNHTLVFSNTSGSGALDHSKIFQRFYRHEHTTQEGNGLGLSIIKQICTDFGFGIYYLYANRQHEFHISLS